MSKKVEKERKKLRKKLEKWVNKHVKESSTRYRYSYCNADLWVCKSNNAKHILGVINSMNKSIRQWICQSITHYIVHVIDFQSVFEILIRCLWTVRITLPSLRWIEGPSSFRQKIFSVCLCFFACEVLNYHEFQQFCTQILE